MIHTSVIHTISGGTRVMVLGIDKLHLQVVKVVINFLGYNISRGIKSELGLYMSRIIFLDQTEHIQWSQYYCGTVIIAMYVAD